jgi:hypothetical protein
MIDDSIRILLYEFDFVPSPDVISVVILHILIPNSVHISSIVESMYALESMIVSLSASQNMLVIVGTSVYKEIL